MVCNEMVITIEKTTVIAQPRQLRGNWSVEPSVFYTPYIPAIFMKQTPAELLHNLHKKYVLWRQSSPDQLNPLEQVVEVMQERFPGPYSIVEAYNPKRGCFELQTRFSDPKQETLWRIKYS